LEHKLSRGDRISRTRGAKSVDEVVELWKKTHAFYAGLLRLWQDIDARGVLAAKDDIAQIFIYCGEQIRKLERASAQAYEFYPSEQAPNAVFEPCEEGGFHAYIKGVSGVHSEGETIEEARENLADAFREILASPN
jgi:hypothetical protein